MKKAVTALVAAFLLSASAFPAYATKIDVQMSAEDACVNRTFDVSVTSDMVDDISGGTLTLSYDSDELEFKDVNSESFEVKYKHDADALKAVFVISDKESRSNELMKVKFKGKSEGVTEVDAVFTELVDRDLNAVQTECSGVVSIEIKKDVDSKNIEPKVLGETLSTTDSASSADAYSISDSGSVNTEVVLYIAGSVGLAVVLSLIARLLLIGKGNS